MHGSEPTSDGDTRRGKPLPEDLRRELVEILAEMLVEDLQKYPPDRFMAKGNHPS